MDEMRQNLFSRSKVALAPLSGYTDAPFRAIARYFGADFAVTGLVSSDGLARGSRESLSLLRRMPEEGPLGVQLFGADPDTMAKAAVLAEERGADFVDLNFGCPVKKVVRRNGGVAIMRDLKLMARIVSSVVEAVKIPVTAKIRSGWSEGERNFLEAGRVIEDCGAAAVTLHPRTRSSGFLDRACWEEIARLRTHLSIPVIANGDVRSVEDDAAIRRKTGCSTVMIGRGALGNPWLFAEIKAALAAATIEKPTVDEKLDVLEQHLALSVEWHGEKTAILEMRKVYRHYLKDIEGARRYRAMLVNAPTYGDVLAVMIIMREEFGIRERRTASQNT